MVKITKAAAPRHEATLSPFVTEFTSRATTVPLHELPSVLTSFPRLWPFSRGDLYHWIAVLNRFDSILESFIEEYDLSAEFQTRPFGIANLLKGDADKCKTVVDGSAPSEEQLRHLGFAEDGDRQLVEQILDFSALLLDNASNRSLYSSSGHLSKLLRTTSSSLLKATLCVAIRLARRFHSSRQRFNAAGSQMSAYLHHHYQLDLDDLLKLAAPFLKSPSISTPQPASAKGREKGPGRPHLSHSSSETLISGADMVSILKNADSDDTFRQQWSGISMSFYNTHDSSSDATPGERADPSDLLQSPSIRRHSVSSRSVHGPSRLSISESSPSTAQKGKDETLRPPDSPRASASITISLDDIASRPSHEILRDLKDQVPESSRRDFATAVRTVKALVGDRQSREDIVAIRMLAIANLAYVYGDAQFQQKVNQQDAEEPRRFQLAHQLAELVHPPEASALAQSKDLQTYALWTLEALTKQKAKQNEVFNALSANVNHGILFYVLRKGVAQLATDDALDDADEEEWREALFTLLTSLPATAPRAGESMMSAGLLNILSEALTLRTRKAERNQWKILNFLDSFVYNVRDAFQTLAVAKGLEAIADLASFAVEDSFARAEQGDGIPEEYRNKHTDYRIPFFQQGTLRWLFKFIDHTMKHNGGNLHRQLRNLIDSSQMLSALRKVLGNSRVYGSNVWSGAVTILSDFIHNEPTSYAVIAEAGLAETFLGAVTGKSADKSVSGPSSVAILPSSDAMQVIPTAIGAICLNENGLKLFQESGALEAFFGIFESPEHLKNFDPESDLPSNLGSSFDELVRHHPALKTRILEAILGMIQRVSELCFKSAAERGVGTKLWLADDNGKLFVAGGWNALRGGRETDAAGDVNMLQDELPAGSNPTAWIDEVVEHEDPKKAPTSTQAIGAVFRFLTGFFQNKSCCQAFLELGGLEPFLDLAVSPSLSYNFDGSLSIESDLTRSIQHVIEEKPHLALPAVMKRIEAAVDDLRPLLDHTSSSPFFAPFTSPSESDENPAIASDGTKYAKALSVVPTLCRAMTNAFMNQVFTQRSQSNIFYQVNLADMYLGMVQNLAQLSSSCTWQEILLQKDMPQSWESITRSNIMIWNDEAEHIFGILQNLTTAATTNGTSPSVPTTNGSKAQPDGPNGVPKPILDQDSAQFKNTKVLRYLLGQVPDSVAPLFQALGRILLIRRMTDPYQKSNAVRVAEQLATAAIEQLHFKPARSAEPVDKFGYLVVVLKSLNSLMTDDAMERPSPQALTLVLQAFKNQGGFAVLDEITRDFRDEINAGTGHEELALGHDGTPLRRALEGTKHLLNFFSRVINSRHVNDASQTQAMTSRSSDRDKPDFFSAAQFLVELRVAVMKPTLRLWDSPIVEKMETPLVKVLIGVLCMELEGESESGAFTRTDKLPKRSKPAPRKWQLRSIEQFERLREEYGDELAREALFRCYENASSARDYCSAHKNHARATRNPIPAGEMLTPAPSPARQDSSNSTAGQLNGSPQPPDLSPGSLLLGLTDADDFSIDPPHPVPAIAAALSGRLFDTLSSDGPDRSPAGPSRPDLIEASQLPEVVTVDDLNNERANLREDLIDRCLDVVNVHDTVTFELADLISAAVSKASDSKNLREDWGSTLLQSLMSLQLGDDVPTEMDFLAQAKKIASYAHLLALVLQDKEFYNATIDELKESFCSLAEFIKIYPDHKSVGTASWIGQVLLILERVLSTDAEPRTIEFTPPAHDDPIGEVVAAEPSPPLINAEDKAVLFNAILEILAHIGKDESLAVSAARILVILTRQRDLATRLGEKMNLQKLFTMVRQLGSFNNERLQSAFMLTLRHIIEDNETVKQIMASEIQVMFDSRQARQTDTTAYTRNLSHLIVRNPQIFVEATNEKCMLIRYDAKHGPQMMALKKEDKPAELAKATEPFLPGSDVSAPAQPPTESVQKDAPDLERTKSHDFKLPVLENSDGVVHFLISELLNYREVEDPAPSKTAENQDAERHEDVEMSNADSSPLSHQQNQRAGHEKDGSPQMFKAEEHSVFIYRCFLLECLTELLSCYNRTKLEFIGYKRRVDQQSATPSKPRSGVLNYLLNNLVPVGFTHHGSTIKEKKLLITSNWATQVVVALCTGTGERGFAKLSRDENGNREEEPDLLLVRKFVLEHALRAFKDAHSGSERLGAKYSRLLALADLFSRMLSKSNGSPVNNNLGLGVVMASHRALAKIMFEKRFIPALTSSIAEIDLNFPDAKRVVKYILRPLRMLTQTAVDLSLNSDFPLQSGDADADEISSASSISDIDDVREETPDLFRNSALGILDPRRGGEDESNSEDEGDEEMFDDEFGDEMEMDYDEDDLPTHDAEEVVSEDEDEIEIDGMPIEGMPGDIDMIPVPGEESNDEEDDESDDDIEEEDMEEEDEDDDDDEEDMDLEEIVEEGDDEVPGADDEDWGTEDNGDEYIGGEELDDEHDPDDDHPQLDDIVRVLDPGGRGLLERLENGAEFDLDDEQEDYLDDEDGDEDEDEEDYDEEDIIYEPDIEDDEDVDIRHMPRMPWDWEDVHPRNSHGHPHRHHHAHSRLHPWGLFGMPGAGGERMIQTSYRSHRSGSAQRANDDGTNPLLQRQGRNGSSSNRRRNGEAANEWFGGGLDRPGRLIATNGNANGPAALISNLLNIVAQQSGPTAFPAGGTFHFQIDGNMPLGPQLLQQFTANGPPGMDAMIRVMGEQARSHDSPHPVRHSRDDPNSVVAFNPLFSAARWMEESRLLFGVNAAEKAQHVINEILRLLIPPAREAQKRREKEEAERAKKLQEEREAAKKAKEEQERKDREEKEAKEKQEREEREAAEAAEAAAKSREQEEQPTEASASDAQAMEGVEQTLISAAGASGPTEPTERVFTTIRGQRVEITGLGIDPEFLEGIPEDMREEVLMAQAVQVRAQQASSDAPQATAIPADFLDQLPPETREELLQQEATERRAREREEARRRATASGAPARAEDMDTASFFATLDPALRQSLLMDADEDTLAALPADLAAEARALGADRRLHHFADPARLARRHGIHPVILGEVAGDDEHVQKKPRPVVQILDKAGVATLLRLMFVHQQGSARVSLNGILRDICANKQNRAEVVSILLSILSDGSSDISAVEKSFKSLTLRAKPPANQKTAQAKQPSPEVLVPGDMSPSMVVQQCLTTLAILVQSNKSMADFFLKEHEMSSSLKSKSQRKGKGKESKARNYPINGLLGLLDRKLVIDSAGVMEQLANLLAHITNPLVALQKREKEKAEEEEERKKEAEAAKQAERAAAPTEAAEEAPATGTAIAALSTEQAVPEGNTSAPTTGEAPKGEEKKEDKTEEKKKPRVLESPPEVPEQNLRLVVGIVAARECNSKTFKDTLALLTNLSTIPHAKDIFGNELVRRAQELGQAVLSDLEDLVVQINHAKSGTDVQGMALSRFSHSGSDQAKLLRVITALDYMFDPKRAEAQLSVRTARNTAGLDSRAKEDILTTLYQNDVFTPLWNKLSEALTAIRKRGGMFNVATILLPLIEVLMVVCKNTTLKDAPLSKTMAREFAIQSPEPETKMESVFFAFTEEHRKILNDLVRHNPKLMSGSFSLLVKNSKVLEFDNKRNFFQRKLHSRGSEIRQPHASLQLSVRRDQVFLDSFKSLYYKKPDEFKYGKLNIRFHGEEGVDAGGVTREWFQVLAKQMFDPNYALFNPVASDRTTFHPNLTSSINPEHLTFFKFIGRIIGKALYEGRVLDCHFSRAVYKRMLGKPVSIKDMETLDLDYYKSLVWMLENDITDIITETFSIESDVFGETKIVDLVEDGRNVPVNEENKHEYVRLVVEHKLIGSVKEQMEHFLIGFHDIVPAELISIFNEQELELLISGLPEIDIDDWKNNTDYHNYQAASSQIQWFWRAVRSFDKEERAKLLQFVTGTSKVPLNGFKELEGMNGFTRFNIHRDYGSKDRLPSSHTCFNQLDLPEYESYEQLRKAVYTAMTAGSEYFGFA